MILVFSSPLAVVTATAVIGLTGLGCGLLLAMAARFLAVHEDERIEALTECLPGINCGACGMAGCADYARAIIQDDAPVNLCKPGGEETLRAICSYLGIEAQAGEREVALVLCGGHDGVAKHQAAYNGIADCTAAERIGGDGKACPFGCLGLGSCARVCPVNAIEITGQRLAVVHPALCIGCQACVKACPRRLIRMVPESRRVHILCRSTDRGPVVRKYCEVGCIGCNRCVKAVDRQGIAMDGALAVVDYTTPIEDVTVAGTCPQATIVIRDGRKEGEG